MIFSDTAIKFLNKSSSNAFQICVEFINSKCENCEHYLYCDLVLATKSVSYTCPDIYVQYAG